MGRQCSGGGETGQTDPAYCGFGSTRDHDIGVIEHDHPRRVADGVRTGRTRGDDSVVRPLETVADGHIARGQIDQRRGNKERPDTARPALVDQRRAIVDCLQPADARADSFVLRGATILTAAGKRFESGFIVVEKGRIDQDQKVLDLGCGSGQLLRQAIVIAGPDGRLTGLDLTPDMLKLTRKELGAGVELVEGNAATGLPFKEQAFDLVTSLNLVQELTIESVPTFFDGVYRLLRPGGTFRAVVPCMAVDNQACETFRRMALARAVMEFQYAGDLERLLLGMPGFVEKKTEFHLSTAAANVAKETVRFTLFADILRDIES